MLPARRQRLRGTETSSTTCRRGAGADKSRYSTNLTDKSRYYVERMLKDVEILMLKDVEIMLKEVEI